MSYQAEMSMNKFYKLGVFHANQISTKSTSELRVRLARRYTGLSPLVRYFTDRSKAVLLLWIFYVFVLSYVCYVFVRVCLFVFFVVTCWERADLLALVCGV